MLQKRGNVVLPETPVLNRIAIWTVVVCGKDGIRIACTLRSSVIGRGTYGDKATEALIDLM